MTKNIHLEAKPLFFIRFSGENGTQRISVYPGIHWPKFGGDDENYRVMLGEKFIARKGEVKSFFTFEGVAKLVTDMTWGAAGVELPVCWLSPGAVRGTLVTWFLPDDAEPFPTRTRTEPFQDENGEWVVWVFGSRRPVPLGYLKPRQPREVAA